MTVEEMTVEEQKKMLEERQLEAVRRFARELGETERALQGLNGNYRYSPLVTAISLRLRYWNDFMRIFKQHMRGHESRTH